MLIEPTQPIMIQITIAKQHYSCQLISLSEEQIKIKSREFLEQESQVHFLAQHFRGQARIQEYSFSRPYFIYHLHIEDIQFLPGLLINTSL